MPVERNTGDKNKELIELGFSATVIQLVHICTLKS